MIEIVKESGIFTSTDGTSIYYESHGEGIPLIFVYGLACQMNHWHQQVSFFSTKYRAITFDIRGHHKSSVPREPSGLTISASTEDLKCLMDHLKIEKAHLLGHSFGVPILIEFSSQHPERALSFSFVNGFAQNPIKGMFGLEIIEPFFYFVKGQYEQAPALWGQIWKSVTHNPFAMWLTTLAGGFNIKLTQFKDIEIYTRGVSQTPLNVFIPLFEDLMNFDGMPLLKDIIAPTLIISGERDSVTPLKFQERMHALIRGSELVVVPYGSHCTQLDFPDYVNLRLEKHFKNAQRAEAAPPPESDAL